jgi:hypothetical protein
MMRKKEDNEISNLQDFRIHKLQQQLSKVIFLSMEEKVISAWTGNRILRPYSRGSVEASGQLFLTNNRLIWIQSQTFSFDLPLEEFISFSLIDWKKIEWGPYYPAEKKIALKSTSSKKINKVFTLNFEYPTGKLEGENHPVIFEKIQKTIEEVVQKRMNELFKSLLFIWKSKKKQEYVNCHLNGDTKNLRVCNECNHQRASVY